MTSTDQLGGATAVCTKYLGIYKHNLSHAQHLYIDTQCFDSRGHFINSGAPVLPWEHDCNQNDKWTPKYLDCTKCSCRSDHCGHRWFQFHENVEKHTCARDVHHKHICACAKLFNVCIEFPSEALKLTFETYASAPHKAMKYGTCDFVGLRKCACSVRITLCSDFWWK